MKNGGERKTGRFRIYFSQLLLDCKNKAKIEFFQILSTKTYTLIVVNNTPQKIVRFFLCKVEAFL